VVGVASVTAVLALSRSVVDTFAATLVRGAGAAQLQVSNGTAGLDRDLVDVIVRLPGVAATGATVEHHVMLPAANQRITIFGAELGRDEAYREAQIGRDVADIHDVLTFLAHTDSIALSPALLAANGWSVGDTIEVIGARGSRTLTIRGTVRSQGFLNAFGGDVALMDLDAAQLQFEAADRVHWIDVVVVPGVDVETVQATIAATLRGRGVVESPAARSRRMDELLSMLRVLLTGTNVVAMIVGIFLIHHALAQSYRQRRADFVRLRTFGLSRWGLVAYVVIEASTLGIAASLAGVLAGVGFWWIATRDFAALISMQFVPIPVPSLSLAPAECGGAIVLGTIVVVVGAVAPLFGIVRHRPGEVPAHAQLPRVPHACASAALAVALVATSVLLARRAAGLGFAGQIVVIAATAGLVFVGSTLFVPVLLLATQPLLSLLRRDSWAMLGRWTWLQACRSRLHTATTMGALAAGVTFAVAMTVLLGSYRAALQQWFRQVFAGDVFVSAGPIVSLLGANTVDRDLADDIARLDTVERVLRWRFVQIQFRGAPIIIQAMAEEILAQTFQASDDGAVAISDSLAERFGLRVGDAFELPAPIAPLALRVGAIVPDYILQLGTVKLPWRMFVRHFGDDRASMLFVDAKRDATPVAVKRAIENLLGTRYDVTVMTVPEARDAVDRFVDQFTALTRWLQILAALVAVAAMVNAMSAAIMDRESQLRSWRALGLFRRRLVWLLVAEAVVIAVEGSFLGVAAGSILGWTLTTSIARAVARMHLPVRWPVMMMTGLPIISTVAVAFAAATVALRRTRGRPLAGASV